MDVNLLEGGVKCRVTTAAIANTTDITNNPAPTIPKVTTPAIRHPIAEKAQHVASAMRKFRECSKKCVKPNF